MVARDVVREMVSSPVKEVVHDGSLRTIDIGKVRSGDVVNEVRLVGISENAASITWMGIFLGKDGAEEWQKWLQGSGCGSENNLDYNALNQYQRDRLNQLATTHIPPIFIFHLALNTDIDLGPIVEKYAQVDGFGPAMFGVTSDESGQGKTVMSVILGYQLSRADIFSAGVQVGEKSDVLLEKLQAENVNVFDVKAMAERINSLTVKDENTKFSSLNGMLQALWDKWSSMSASQQLIVDLPAMKKVDGQNTRLTDGIDLLWMAMPSYKFEGKRVSGKEEFDWEHFNKFISGLRKAHLGTFGIDDDRRQGLRECFRRKELGIQ